MKEIGPWGLAIQMAGLESSSSPADGPKEGWPQRLTQRFILGYPAPRIGKEEYGSGWCQSP